MKNHSSADGQPESASKLLLYKPNSRLGAYIPGVSVALELRMNLSQIAQDAAIVLAMTIAISAALYLALQLFSLN
jgi:hypothetical protein